MAGNRKEYEMLLQLSAQLSGSYNSTFTKAQAQVASMQKEIQSLSKYQADISAYQKQQSAIEASRQKLATLQQQYDNIQKEIGETEGYSSALENRLLSKQQQIEKTSASIDRQTQSLRQMREALDAAGIDVKDLENESARLGSEMEDLKQKQDEMKEAAERMGNSGAQAVQAYQQALVASGIQDALRAVFDELQACVDASVEFESALTGVDKTTNLTESELAEMSDAVKDLALEIPVTTDEMLGIGEVAGQLGIAKENILDFSATMSMLSTSTSMAADEGATMLAQFANITQMDQTMYDELASSIVALGNSYATTEQKITEMSTGIAASASLAGMSEADMLGLSAAVSSLGIETQMGSTAVSKLISMLMTAVETGDGLEDLAHIAGMSADQFADAWGKNAVGALESFVVGLSDTERLGQSAIVTLTDLGVTETRMQRTILSLSNSGDLLTRTIATANQAWDENIALSEEAAKRYATTASQQALMENAFKNLRIAIGDNYTPILRELYSVAADVLSGMTEFVEANPALVKAVTAATGVIGLATAGVTAYVATVKIAHAVTGLFASTLGTGVIGPIAAVTAGVAALAGIVGAASEAVDEEAKAFRELTSASQAEYYQLQDLNEEYEAVCAQYGESHEEARELAGQIDYLTEQYESNRQSISEYREEVEAATESTRAMLSANREAYEEISDDEYLTLALVTRLRDLASQTDKTVETQEEMKAIITELNGIVPELAISYEDAANGVTDYAAAVEATVKAQAAAQRYEKAQQNAADALTEKEQATRDLENATNQQAAAQARLNAAEKEYWDTYDTYSQNGSNPWAGVTMWFTDEYAEYNAAKEELETYNAAIEEHSDTLNAATAEHQKYLNELVGYVEETNESSNTTAELNARINETIAEVESLAEAYTLAYNAAYESVSGQYSLWDEASEVVATSAGTINTALDSQVTYWQNYNSNLASLAERGKEIEGLGDMLASFADGSTDSVNAVAGMATATDEELAAMVTEWQTLQAEQKKVADSIAELTKNLDEEMAALQQSLESDIEAMNLSEEAAASGKYTVEGFINGAEDMLPQVQAAYRRLANAAIEALGFDPSGNGTTDTGINLPGYAGGTHNAERGFAIVGENGPELVYFNGGEQVMTAAETAAAMAAANNLQTRAAEVQALMNPVRTEAIIARSADTGNGSSQLPPIQVSITVEGDASADTAETLKAATGEVIEAVLEAIDERDQDRQRRSYS